MQKFNGKMSPREWTKKQIHFIENHKYYTQTAKEKREVEKEKQLAELRDLLKRQ
jgi:hypothetical protein